MKNKNKVTINNPRNSVNTGPDHQFTGENVIVHEGNNKKGITQVFLSKRDRSK
jgi:hypothetical protein